MGWGSRARPEPVRAAQSRENAEHRALPNSVSFHSHQHPLRAGLVLRLYRAKHEHFLLRPSRGLNDQMKVGGEQQRRAGVVAIRTVHTLPRGSLMQVLPVAAVPTGRLSGQVAALGLMPGGSPLCRSCGYSPHAGGGSPLSWHSGCLRPPQIPGPTPLLPPPPNMSLLRRTDNRIKKKGRRLQGKWPGLIHSG